MCVTVGMLRQVILCKTKKQQRPAQDPPFVNSANGTARYSLTLKNIK